jgi:hypothetical protein
MSDKDMGVEIGNTNHYHQNATTSKGKLLAAAAMVLWGATAAGVAAYFMSQQGLAPVKDSPVTDVQKWSPDV